MAYKPDKLAEEDVSLLPLHNYHTFPHRLGADAVKQL